MNLETFTKVMNVFPSFQPFIHIFHKNGSNILNKMIEVANFSWKQEIKYIECATADCSDINNFIKNNEKDIPFTIIISEFHKANKDLSNTIIKEFFFNYHTNFAPNTHIVILEKKNDETYDNTYIDPYVSDKFSHFSID